MTTLYSTCQTRARGGQPYRGNTTSGGVVMATWSTIKQQLSSVQSVRFGVASALTAAVAVCLTTASSAAPAAGPERVTGWRAQLGKGDVTSFAELQPSGVPKTVGIALSGAALASLPPEPSDQHHC